MQRVLSIDGGARRYRLQAGPRKYDNAEGGLRVSPSREQARTWIEKAHSP